MIFCRVWPCVIVKLEWNGSVCFPNAMNSDVSVSKIVSDNTMETLFLATVDENNHQTTPKIFQISFIRSFFYHTHNPVPEYDVWVGFEIGIGNKPLVTKIGWQKFGFISNFIGWFVRHSIGLHAWLCVATPHYKLDLFIYDGWCNRSTKEETSFPIWLNALRAENGLE